MLARRAPHEAASEKRMVFVGVEACEDVKVYLVFIEMEIDTLRKIFSFICSPRTAMSA